MPKIAVCAKCRRKSCDGGIWKMVRCDNSNKKDCIALVPRSKLTNCTKSLFNKDLRFQNAVLSSVAYRVDNKASYVDSTHPYFGFYRETWMKVEM